jgi:hypothetical protein
MEQHSERIPIPLLPREAMNSLTRKMSESTLTRTPRSKRSDNTGENDNPSPTSKRFGVVKTYDEEQVTKSSNKEEIVLAIVSQSVEDRLQTIFYRLRYTLQYNLVDL